jgi:Leucine-rich repeat (LRR) protein
MFLQYGGYSAMENLESLSGVRSLWLDYNCFTRVENLAPLTQLTTLYLSNNNLSSLAGISTLPSLILLDASRNALTAVAPGDLRGLKLLKTLDLSANRLTDISGVVDATALTYVAYPRCPAALLHCLNPAVRSSRLSEPTLSSPLYVAL